MTRIAVVDYGAGNLVSIDQALRAAGAEVVIARRGVDVREAAGLIVPGVGAAGPAMVRLAQRDLVAPIRDWVAADRPFLGICLGMQLLFDESGEDGARTLGILPGHTRRLVGAPRLPHIGWNAVRRRRDHPLFDGVAPDALFYFVHSFAPLPAGPEAEALTLAVTDHGQDFVSAVARGRLVGVQFHPERSGRDGLRLLAAFVTLATASRATGVPPATPGVLPILPGIPAGSAPPATAVRAPGSAS